MIVLSIRCGGKGEGVEGRFVPHSFLLVTAARYRTAMLSTHCSPLEYTEFMPSPGV
jgi:hypothetical protein